MPWRTSQILQREGGVVRPNILFTAFLMTLVMEIKIVKHEEH